MPRPIHFEIHAATPDRAIAFYTALFDWKFQRWGTEPYWLVTTGDKAAPGIDGGLLERRGPPPAEMAAVNAFVCTVDVPSVDDYSKRVVELGGTIALPKMAVPTVGWLAYAKDPEGNLFGMITMDANAK